MSKPDDDNQIDPTPEKQPGRISRTVTAIANKFGDHLGYPAKQIEGAEYQQFMSAVARHRDDDAPLIRVRPPRENEGVDASVRLHKTLHDPIEFSIRVPLGGIWELTPLFGEFLEQDPNDGKWKFVRNDSRSHAHEIWYDEGKVQFFVRPDAEYADQFERQIKNNYKNATTERVEDTAFPMLDEGDYVAAAEIRPKKEFWNPIKSSLTEKGDDEPITEHDPYADITSDMVVEEDRTSDGERVTADESRVIIQTVYEPARDVWSQSRPWGYNVNKAAHAKKQGTIEESFIRGIREIEAGTKDRKAAKIIEKQRGVQGYYATTRVIAISPYKEIAERRARTVAGDFERYYDSFTEQGLEPHPVDVDRIPEVLADAASRSHNISTYQRYARLNQSKYLLTVYGLASICHFPSEEINTPAVDWAKMESGPGVPADVEQMEDVTGDDGKDDEQRVQRFDATAHSEEDEDDTSGGLFG